MANKTQEDPKEVFILMVYKNKLSFYKCNVVKD